MQELKDIKRSLSRFQAPNRAVESVRRASGHSVPEKGAGGLKENAFPPAPPPSIAGHFRGRRSSSPPKAYPPDNRSGMLGGIRWRVEGQTPDPIDSRPNGSASPKNRRGSVPLPKDLEKVAGAGLIEAAPSVR